MIFHENRLLADDSHEISYLIFFRKLGKMSQNLSSAAVVIGALRVNAFVKKKLLSSADFLQNYFFFSKNILGTLSSVSNSLDPGPTFYWS